MSDFSNIDTMIPKALHKDLYETYVSKNKKDLTKRKPFERNLDLWFLGFCIAVKKGLRPVKITGQTVKGILGPVFVKNKQHELIIKHIMVEREGVEILLDPAKMHKIANELSTAGLSEIKDYILQDPDELELDNLLDSIKELLG